MRLSSSARVCYIFHNGVKFFMVQSFLYLPLQTQVTMCYGHAKQTEKTLVLLSPFNPIRVKSLEDIANYV
jgi:hypothetical protein